MAEVFQRCGYAGVLAFTARGLAAEPPAIDCLSGLRASLVRGHFTGPLVCSGPDATFRLAGRTSHTRYSIYDYRYRHPPPDGQVMHGGQKIVGNFLGCHSQRSYRCCRRRYRQNVDRPRCRWRLGTYYQQQIRRGKIFVSVDMRVAQGLRDVARKK